MHFAGDATIDALTLPFLFTTQHTAAFGFPQMDDPSHFLMSLRHALSGMRAVRLASLSVLFTHLTYLPCVWPARVQPQVSWMVARPCAMAAASGHFVLLHSATAGAA